MSAITVTTQGKEVLELPQRIADELQRASLKKVMGRGAANLIADKLFEDNATHANKLGGERTNFYSDAAKSVLQPSAVTVVSQGVTVSINQQGFAQRYFGGTINAKPGSALTIPVAPEAYGHRAREFANLRLIIIGPQHVAVLAAIGGVGVVVGRALKRAKIGAATILDNLTILYLLLKSVTQQGDTSLLPTDDQIAAAAIDAGNKFVDDLLKNGGK